MRRHPPVFVMLVFVVLSGCADPCADLAVEPLLTLGSSNEAGTSFEAFEDGAPLALIQGPQLGMHIWLQLRLDGFCPSNMNVDRRVIDDETEALIDIQRGPTRFVDGPDVGSFVLEEPLTMFLCPTDRPIVDQRLRFAVRAEDAYGHTDIAMRPFVATCTSGECPLCDVP